MHTSCLKPCMHASGCSLPCMHTGWLLEGNHSLCMCLAVSPLFCKSTTKCAKATVSRYGTCSHHDLQPSACTACMHQRPWQNLLPACMHSQAQPPTDSSGAVETFLKTAQKPTY